MIYRGGFINEENVYDLLIEYFSRKSGAPDFHIKFMPFPIVASRVNGMHRFHYGMTRLNFMILLVGTAYISQKSSLIGLVQPFAKDGFINSGSVQAIWDELEKYNNDTVLHVVDEYSGVLRIAMKRDSWLTEYAPAMASIFTQGCVTHKVRGYKDKKKEGILTKVENVSYNFLGGIQPPVLESLLSREYVEVGFFPRHLILCVNDSEYKDCTVKRLTPEQIEWERDIRTRIFNNLPRPTKKPLICDYTDSALEAFNKAKSETIKILRKDPENLINYFRSRYIDYYIKVGDMLAIMDGSRQYYHCQATNDVFIVEEEYVLEAVKMVREVVKRLDRFYGLEMSRGAWDEVKNRIVNMLMVSNRWISHSQLLRGSKSDAYTFRCIMDTLIEGGLVEMLSLIHI